MVKPRLEGEYSTKPKAKRDGSYTGGKMPAKSKDFVGGQGSSVADGKLAKDATRLVNKRV